jgi:hypothetical protein
LASSLDKAVVIAADFYTNFVTWHKSPFVCRKRTGACSTTNNTNLSKVTCQPLIFYQPQYFNQFYFMPVAAATTGGMVATNIAPITA